MTYEKYLEWLVTWDLSKNQVELVAELASKYTPDYMEELLCLPTAVPHMVKGTLVNGSLSIQHGFMRLSIPNLVDGQPKELVCKIKGSIPIQIRGKEDKFKTTPVFKATKEIKE